MTADEMARVELCARECEACLRQEARFVRMSVVLPDALGVAADWADAAEFWAEAAFRVARGEP